MAAVELDGNNLTLLLDPMPCLLQDPLYSGRQVDRLPQQILVDGVAADGGDIDGFPLACGRLRGKRNEFPQGE